MKVWTLWIYDSGKYIGSFTVYAASKDAAQEIGKDRYLNNSAIIIEVRGGVG